MRFVSLTEDGLVTFRLNEEEDKFLTEKSIEQGLTEEELLIQWLEEITGEQYDEDEFEYDE